MPALTAGVSPKSSALTISLRTSRHRSRRSLAGHPAEVEPDGFLELSPRTDRGLDVLELLEVELERHALPLDAVQLGRKSAPLVGLGEDEAGSPERAIVLPDLLDDLGQHSLDILGLGGRHRRECRGQLHVCHRAAPRTPQRFIRILAISPGAVIIASCPVLTSWNTHLPSSRSRSAKAS